MAVEAPDVEEFDRPDLRLSAEHHQVQAEMAAERGEDYDPYEFEKRSRERQDQWPDLDDAEPVEGMEDLHRERQEAGQ